GAAAAVVGAGMALFVEDDPGARGLGPDGDPPLPDGAPGGSGVSVGDAVRTRRFVGLYAGCLGCSFGLFLPFVHPLPYAADHGIARVNAVMLVGIIGVGSTGGRFFLGGLADRVGRRLAVPAMFAGMALALVVWALATTLWPLVAFAFVYGIFYGGFVALVPAFVADSFGGRHISRIIRGLDTTLALCTLARP